MKLLPDDSMEKCLEVRDTSKHHTNNDLLPINNEDSRRI
jgi:hypothetical protein